MPVSWSGRDFLLGARKVPYPLRRLFKRHVLHGRVADDEVFDLDLETKQVDGESLDGHDMARARRGGLVQRDRHQTASAGQTEPVPVAVVQGSGDYAEGVRRAATTGDANQAQPASHRAVRQPGAPKCSRHGKRSALVTRPHPCLPLGREGQDGHRSSVGVVSFLKTPRSGLHDATSGYASRVNTAQSPDRDKDPAEAPDVQALLPMVRRVVGARVGTHNAAQDLVQETLARVLAAAGRIDPATMEAYAITTARNLIATMWRDEDRQARNVHRALEISLPDTPDDEIVAAEEKTALAEALDRLTLQERETLLAHELGGLGTRELAEESGTSVGAVAAQLHRTRARLRVEYLIALGHREPPTAQCRPVLLALSTASRRRQRELDADQHLLECAFCSAAAPTLLGRGRSRDDEVRIAIESDADIVKARQTARVVASGVGFSGTELTVLATAVSEVSRNIVRFAGAGQVVVEVLTTPRLGIRIVARDAGPGIPDVGQAMGDGFSTYAGLGLGLPGAQRLMDEFTVVSEIGRGTTVTMTKWHRER